jgi:hypothetical protein
LTSAGYRDDGGILSLRDPLKAIDLGAHGIDSFVPDSKTLGHSIVSPEDEARYRAHHGMIDRYRSDVMDLRTGLSASWEIPKLAVKDGLALGRAAANEITQDAHAVGLGGQYIAHEAARGAHAVKGGAQHAARAVEHTTQSIVHAVHDGVLNGVHANEQVMSHGVHAVEHRVQHAAQAIEHTARNVAHTVDESVSHGVLAAEHAVHSLASEASQVFDRLRHPGSWFDNPAADGAPHLDQATHPDHPLYRQARSAVHRLDAEHQRAPDQRSDNLAAALVVAARREGLNKVDHAVLSDNASRVFAVEGDTSSPFRRVADVQTAEAVATSIDASSMAWQQIMQTRQSDRMQAAPHFQQQLVEQHSNPAPPM